MSLLAESVARDARQAGLLEVLLEAPLVVGVSGGADSLALLSVLRQLRGTGAAGTLHVAHLDHGFRAEASAADARFVEALAHEWGLPCTVARFDVPAYAASRKLSPEDAARRVRYTFLAGVAHEQGRTVAVAHTADDQAETVLMHLLRGSGVSGLTGMRMLSDVPVGASDPELAALARNAALSSVRVLRPLLGAWRAEIDVHCQEAGLEPRQDATNLDPAYRRNFIRHNVLPLLEAASPQARRHLARLANIAAAEDDVLQRITEQEWERLGLALEDNARIVAPTAAIAALPLGLSRRIVRQMLQVVAGRAEDLDFQQVEAARQVLSGAPGSPPAVDLTGGLRARRAGGTGIVERRAEDGVARLLTSSPDKPLVRTGTSTPLEAGSTHPLANGWCVTARVLEPEEAVPTPGDYLALFDLDSLTSDAQLVLRTREPGDTIQPLGLGGRKKLQDVLVDAKIPREMRDHLPVVALSGPGAEVLWVPGPGGRRSAIAPITGHTRRLLCIEFQPPSEASQEAEGSP
jgi:tRNA(Ile)-lysidine synthase